ncbi:MAG: hypothetical protein PVI21_01600 [Candidatus Woesebacteria bacterium]|jgi:hypothetical protein
MHGLRVERRSLEDRSLSRLVADEILGNVGRGKTVVVTDSPAGLLAATKKRWLKIIRRVECERSSTLNAARIAEYSQKITQMRRLHFSVAPLQDILTVDVTFATAESLVQMPPTCAMLLVTYEFEREKLYMMTAWMSRNGLVVIYDPS